MNDEACNTKKINNGTVDQFPPQRALITGVAGFAGGFLAEHLLSRGDAVLGAAPGGQWEPNSSGAIRDQVELVAWDLGSEAGLGGEARRRIGAFRPSAVYHLAALSIPDDCGKEEPLPAALAVNVEGTRRVVELAAGLPSRPRLLMVSSAKVYAPVGPGNPFVTETSPLGPRAAYGRTKLAAEQIVREAVARRECDAVIARAFQHTGPRQRARMMLPEWACQFASGDSGPVEVRTCDAVIDLSDVRDVVRAYRLLMACGERGGVYNVGSGRPRRSGEVLDILRNLAGPDRPVCETRPGPKHDAIANTMRLIQNTGWQPEIPLQQTVADTWAYWKELVAGCQ